MPDLDLAELVEVLNAWPPDAAYAQKDAELIRSVFALAQIYGYDRTRQVAKAIHDIWSRPEHLDMYRHQKAKHLEVLEENRKTILDDT